MLTLYSLRRKKGDYSSVKDPLGFTAFVLELIIQMRRPALLEVLLIAQWPLYQHVSDAYAQQFNDSVAMHLCTCAKHASRYNFRPVITRHTVSADLMQQRAPPALSKLSKVTSQTAAPLQLRPRASDRTHFG
jgi:hypothetical protein